MADAMKQIEDKMMTACEPVIVHLEKMTERGIRIDLNKIVEAMNMESPDTNYGAWFKEYRKNHQHDDSSLFHLFEDKKNRGYYESEKATVSDMIINEERLNRFIVSAKQSCREYNLYKLRDAIHRYIVDIFVDATDIKVEVGNKGCEVNAKLIHKNGEKWHFYTHAISAGGWNIQCFHYRYLITVTDPTGNDSVILHHVTAKEKAEKDAKRNARAQEQVAKKLLTAGKKIATLAQAIRKEGTKLTILKEIIDRLPKKRQEITDAVVKYDINLSIFDDVTKIYLAHKNNFQEIAGWGAEWNFSNVMYAIREYREALSKMN